MDGGNEQRVAIKILFQSWSVGDRNTSIGAKGLWEWGSEPIKRFLGGILDFEMEGSW